MKLSSVSRVYNIYHDITVIVTYLLDKIHHLKEFIQGRGRFLRINICISNISAQHYQYRQIPMHFKNYANNTIIIKLYHMLMLKGKFVRGFIK